MAIGTIPVTRTNYHTADNPSYIIGEREYQQGTSLGSLANASDKFKNWIGMLTQTSTNAPTPTVLFNDLGDAGTWSRAGAGSYVMTATNRFTPDNKTICWCNSGVVGVIMGAKCLGSNLVLVTSQANPGSALDDALLTGAVLSVRVYT